MADERQDPATPPSGDEDTTKSRDSERPPPEQRRIGPYVVVRELGQGGMGTVYLAARADDQYEKRVAIKVLRAGMESQEMLRHFRRERQILAGLEHPNIARLLDGGATDEGAPYFVMEYIQGQRIDEYCDRRKLSVTQRMGLCRDVCAAVQHAHRNLVVHRDIKPSNIVVTAEGVPKLLDFGLAKFLNAELSGDGAQTATHLAMTPEYASPEQARGEAITTATDVYSLGVVLYKLLTGHYPYRVRNRPTVDILRAVIEDEPEKPSTSVYRTEADALRQGESPITAESLSRAREGTPPQLQRRLEGDVDNILLMALRKEPERRYLSVEAFSEDIKRHLEARPVLARKGTLAYRGGKFLGRNRIGVAVAATIILSLTALGANVWIQSRRVAGALDRAEKVSNFLVDLFKVSDPGESRGNSVTAREMLDKGAAQIQTSLKDQPEVRAALMGTMGRVFGNLGLYDKALPLLQESLEAERRTLGGQNLEVARSLTSLANVVNDKGDYARAESLYREALAMKTRLLGKESPEVAELQNGLALVLDERGQYPEAEALLRATLATQKKVLGDRHTDVAMTLTNLGKVLYEKGDYNGAEPMFREALAMARVFLGDVHPDVAMNLNNLAGVEYARGNYDAAAALLRDVLALNRKLFGDVHPDVAMSLGNLADCLHAKGDDAAAEKAYREALEIDRQLLRPDAPQVAGRMTGLADTLLREGKAVEAESTARAALVIRRKDLPKGHPGIAETETVLGRCLIEAHRYEEAQALLADAYEALRSGSGAQTGDLRKVLEGLLRLADVRGKTEDAARYRSLLLAATKAESTP
jgi:serine/threonine protein kinase/Tfp pilus assembly protein PilF